MADYIASGGSLLRQVSGLSPRNLILVIIMLTLVADDVLVLEHVTDRTSTFSSNQTLIDLAIANQRAEIV